MNSNWSNGQVGGGNWEKFDPVTQGWVAQGQNLYPGKIAQGMQNSTDDVVLFNQLNTGPATLDVGINPLNSLQITQQVDTLTLNVALVVSGNTGTFIFTDAGSTIQLGANTFLILEDLGPQQGGPANLWSGGSITGAANTTVYVNGSSLTIRDAPGNLGTNLVVQKYGPTGNNGIVTMIAMTNNLTLSGTNNYIDLGNGGILDLSQQIAAAGQENTEGCIDFAPAHTGTLAVQVEVGGTFRRSSVPFQGIVDQVSVAGAVYNGGGVVQVSVGGDMLKITGQDANGYSYWQKTAASAKLQVDANANITATGKYQIDIGTVQLTAPGGAGADELDGAGLIFGRDNNTFLTIVDAVPMLPGMVTVQGPVTLGRNTTTTLNYVGMNNQADLLDVKNGRLTLDGTLKLNSLDGQKPTQALNFFDDTGNNPLIVNFFLTVPDCGARPFSGGNRPAKRIPGDCEASRRGNGGGSASRPGSARPRWLALSPGSPS